jgi:hypothetical protein
MTWEREEGRFRGNRDRPTCQSNVPWGDYYTRLPGNFAFPETGGPDWKVLFLKLGSFKRLDLACHSRKWRPL